MGVNNGSNVYPVFFTGDGYQPADGVAFGSNHLVNSGTATITMTVTNDGSESTTYSVSQLPGGSLVDSGEVASVPIFPEEYSFATIATLNTAQLSGTYGSEFIVSNDGNSLDPNESFSYFVYLLDAPALTHNGDTTVNASASATLSVSNGATAPHAGARRAAAELTEVSIAGPFQVSTWTGVTTGVLGNEFVLAGDTATATVSTRRGLPSGTYIGNVRLGVNTKSENGFFVSGAEPLDDIVWDLSTTVPGRDNVTHPLVLGQSFSVVPSINNPTSAAVLLDGTSSASQMVTLAFGSDPEDGSAPSAIVFGTPADLHFELPGDQYVLQLAYVDGELPIGFVEKDARVMYYDSTAMEWIRAIDANSDGGAGDQLFQGSFDEFVASLAGASVPLSAQGVDTINNQIWAVLDHNSLLSTGALLSSLNCDFDGANACSLDDLNSLLGEGAVADGVVVTPGVNEQFDLNYDGLIDTTDRDLWLARAARATGRELPFLPGDANLDGVVNELDFQAWQNHLFSVTTSWNSGDFNGDGLVDVKDFNVWNKYKSVAADTASVPEPASGLGLAVGVLGLWGARRRV
ncbi:MAG: PEP-CTERM sorting domain-containing protein [Planctomycetales bacterium]|nr:PEP-CTERM sorting domain-containing protein [Planctomycetales bacterium]